MLVILELLLLATLALLSFLLLRRIYRFFVPIRTSPNRTADTMLDHKSAIDAAEDVASYGVIAALVAKAGVAIASPGAIGAALMWLGLANVPLLLTLGPIVLYFSAAAIAALAVLKLYGKRKLREQKSRITD